MYPDYFRVSIILIISTFVFVLIYTKHEDFVYQLDNSSTNDVKIHINADILYACLQIGSIQI